MDDSGIYRVRANAEEITYCGFNQLSLSKWDYQVRIVLALAGWTAGAPF
jgi:hypothetical protein